MQQAQAQATNTSKSRGPPPRNPKEAAKMNNYLRYVQGDGWRLDKYGKEAFNGNTEEPSDLEKLTYFYRKKVWSKFPKNIFFVSAEF